MLIFFAITFTVLGLAYGYIGWRIIIPAELNSPWSWIAWAVLFLFLIIPYVATYLHFTGKENPFTDVLSWIGYIGLGFFSLVFVFVLAKDVIWLLGIAGEKIITFTGNLFSDNTRPSLPPDPERRRFLINSINLGILGVSGMLTGYGIFEARRSPYLKEVTVPIKNLHKDLDGYTIVQFTDIHVGPTVKRSYVKKIVDQINGIEKDLVVFTGDLVDGSVKNLRDDVEPLRQISSPNGYYFVTGNHEYYSGVEEWIKEAEKLGFKVLINEHQVLTKGNSKIILAGVTDTSGGQFLPEQKSDPHKALLGAPEADIKILLAHQPRSLYESSKAGYDLQISGHTHGGQYIPWNFMAKIGQPFIKGLHLFDKTWIYVSMGTGYWGPPLRIGARSEITLIKLKKV